MKKLDRTSPSIVRDHACADRADLGGKAGALAALTRAGFPVPRWIVVTPAAFERSAGGRQELDRTAWDSLRLDPEVESELLEALPHPVSASERFAVRSSARDEDSAEHSFAGQLETFLFVAREDVARRVVDVWRSGFSPRVRAYRREHGLQSPPTVPSVLVQVMVDADASGVAFSADPVRGDHHVAVVGSVHGLGTALVSGDADGDTHRIDRDGRVVSREIAHKTFAHRFSPVSPEGVAAFDLAPADRDRSVLNDEQAIAVAGLARRSEEFFGAPQDIEWALAGGSLHLLQSRPITSLGGRPAGALNIWDNSNVAESYQGVTTPLTFSFARYAYEGVYTQLCRIFGMNGREIEELGPALGSMIGLIRGRVYYNVLNWYRLLRRCPGYRFNAAFFERMIGLKETVPEDALETDAHAGSRLVDLLRLVRTSASILLGYFLLKRSVPRFHQRVDRALADCPDLSGLSADALVREYRLLVRRLVTRWDAPLVNDFFAMIFYGLLHRCCVRWCGDESGTLQNDLLCSSGGMVSTEPVRRMERMARIARTDPQFREMLSHGTVAQIREAMELRAEFRQEFDSYLERFGERCNEELKLESSTLHDDPTMLLRAVGSLAAQDAPGKRCPGTDPLDQALVRTREALKRNPLRWLVFRWVHANARRTIRNRENLRLERTRVFGRVRRIFLEIGQRLVDASVIPDARDVFYLEVDEVLGFVEGTAATVDLAGLAAARRQEFELYREQPSPPARFESHGPVYLDSSWQSRTIEAEPDGAEVRAGTGCCPGVVTGPVRVVTDPRDAVLEPGSILVAERTDPGWIMLFPMAAGLLVQHGNLLSHSAIVSREMGIPAIVAVGGVMRWLHDGDTVELDGTTGVVRRLAIAGGAS